MWAWIVTGKQTGTVSVSMLSEREMADTRGPAEHGEQGMGRRGLRAVRIWAQQL